MVLTLVVSLVEVISISAVVPFLALLSSPNQLDGYKWLSLLLNKISFLNPDNLLFCVTVVFIFLTIFSAVLRLLLLFVQTKLSYAIGAEYSLEIYRKTLYQSYEVHLNQNSSEFISGITSKVNNIISNAVNPVLVIVSCAFMLLAICSTLIFIEPLVTIAVFTFFAFIYLIVYGLTKKRLLINGLEVSAEQSKVIKTVQEGLGGIRDILLDGSQPIFTRIYGVADYKLRQAQATIYIIGNCPRYVIEAFGIVIIAVIAYLLTSGSSGFSAAIPVLGVIAFSAQRLLPLLQNAYASWVSIQGGLGALADAMNLLNQPISKYMGQPKDPIAFESQIVLRDVYFCYNSSTKWTLENLNLTITKGTRLGIIGPTGGGKSTLLDVLMGLLMPTKGNLIVDEQIIGEEQLSSWQSIIAHVPQNIFLADITIAENIAFGVECSFIDYDRVKKAASQAELSETIEEWGLKYDTVVGERGIRLSGGQRQRIGIARALYKNAKVIIFDEATSALDYETEESIIRAINTLDRDITIVTVAHRLTTLRHSDLIIKIEGGQCKVQGSYDDIIHE
jgi:ATP-binding cassette subfamily B protein